MNNEQKKKLSSQLKKESMSKEVKTAMEKSRANTRIRKQIVDCIKDEFRIVPEIAEATNLSKELIFWHLMTLRKYGSLLEGEERDDYIEYSVKK